MIKFDKGAKVLWVHDKDNLLIVIKSSDVCEVLKLADYSFKTIHSSQLENAPCAMEADNSTSTNKTQPKIASSCISCLKMVFCSKSIEYQTDACKQLRAGA